MAHFDVHPFISIPYRIPKEIRLFHSRIHLFDTTTQFSSFCHVTVSTLYVVDIHCAGDSPTLNRRARSNSLFLPFVGALITTPCSALLPLFPHVYSKSNDALFKHLALYRFLSTASDSCSDWVPISSTAMWDNVDDATGRRKKRRC